MQNLDDYVWVFIGCGGTFHAASPYLAVLRRRYSPPAVIFIDPDEIREDNYGRQWPGWNPGTTKASAAEEMICDPISAFPVRTIVGQFNPSDSVIQKKTEGRPVLAIVNVDNDQCRLDVANWLASRVSPGIMVVSGCERTHGQCYPGIWMGGQPVFDWREYHPDVGQGGPPQGQCNVQNIRANALTGVLVGMCIEDIADRLQMQPNGITEVLEFYWSALPDPDAGSVKMWDALARCRKEAPQP